MPGQDSTGWGLVTHFAECFISCRLPLPEQEGSAFQAADNDAKCSCFCIRLFPLLFCTAPSYLQVLSCSPSSRQPVLGSCYTTVSEGLILYSIVRFHKAQEAHSGVCSSAGKQRKELRSHSH